MDIKVHRVINEEDKGLKSLHDCLWHKERRENQEGLREEGGKGAFPWGGSRRRRAAWESPNKSPKPQRAA